MGLHPDPWRSKDDSRVAVDRLLGNELAGLEAVEHGRTSEIDIDRAGGH